MNMSPLFLVAGTESAVRMGGTAPPARRSSERLFDCRFIDQSPIRTKMPRKKKKPVIQRFIISGWKPPKLN
ncbi:MAG: hypothetical protein ACJAXZ_001827 [Akkermansiaceae bacterium]|jgi:hypothetical protein